MLIDNPPLTREEQLTALYQKAFPLTAAFVRKMGGSFDEAKDVFQDALVIWYEKQLEENFHPEQNESAYLLGIAKHLWYKTYRSKRQQQSLDENFELQDEPQPDVSQSLLQFLERSGKKCMELLKAFYYEKLSMKELAPRFGFSGERSATAQKYKCLEKVRNAIREQSLSKEDFYE